MSYKAPSYVYLLTFDDPELFGLEVRALGLTLAEYLGTDQTVDTRAGMIERFFEALESWNLTDKDDVPIEPTLEGSLSINPKFVWKCVTGWYKTVTEVADPLDELPSESQQSAVPPMTMEVLPESEAS